MKDDRNSDRKRDVNIIPATVKDILERNDAKKVNVCLTLDELAGVRPDKYSVCDVKVLGFMKNYQLTLEPQQAYALARMNRILQGPDNCAVSREEFIEISDRLKGCPGELVRENMLGYRTPSATARSAEYVIRKS